MTADPRHAANEKNVAVALASAPGTAALAVIQIVGPDAATLLSACSHAAPPNVGGLRLMTLRDADAQPIDRALIACLSDAPRRFDISCHGGVRVVQRLLSRLVELGAEPIDPMTGIDDTYRLTSAIAHDAYQRLPHAKTLLAAEFLLHQANGEFESLLEKPSLTADDRRTLTAAADGFALTQRLLFGATVAIVGPPNAGKSTLLNALADRDRALVADHPGTTRDAVHADVEIAGLPITFIDTAGLGHTLDPLHEIVREKTLSQLADAHLLLILLAAASPIALESQLAELLALPPIASHHAAHRTRIVINKSDAAPHRPNTLADLAALTISAKNALGLDALHALLIDALGLADFDPKTPRAFTSAQHARIVERLRH